MSYLEVFEKWTGVGVDVSKLFSVGAGAGVLKPEAGAESESEKCDFAHLCRAVPHKHAIHEVAKLQERQIHKISYH